MEKILIDDTQLLCTKKIYSRLSNRHVIFVGNYFGVQLSEHYAYCDGETLIDHSGNGTVEDVYCIMKDGTEIRLCDIYSAYQTLNCHCTESLETKPFHLPGALLDRLLQDETDINQSGLSDEKIMELKSVANQYISVISPILKSINAAEIYFGKEQEINNFADFITDLNTKSNATADDATDEDGEDYLDYDHASEVDTGINDVKAFTHNGDIVAYVKDRITGYITNSDAVFMGFMYANTSTEEYWISLLLHEYFRDKHFKLCNDKIEIRNFPLKRTFMRSAFFNPGFGY